MKPEIKFLTISCRPNPIPTPRAPASNAKLFRSIPAPIIATNIPNPIIRYDEIVEIAPGTPRARFNLGRTSPSRINLTKRAIITESHIETKNRNICPSETEKLPITHSLLIASSTQLKIISLIPKFLSIITAAHATTINFRILLSTLSIFSGYFFTTFNEAASFV